MNALIVLTTVLLGGNDVTSSSEFQQPVIHVSPVSHLVEFEASGSGLIKVAARNNEISHRSTKQQSLTQPSSYRVSSQMLNLFRLIQLLNHNL